MIEPSIRRYCAAALCLLVATSASAAAAAEPLSDAEEQEPPLVCAQVVLALDASGSTRDGAFRRQVEAFRTAFGSARLYRAIQDCMPGKVAFAVTTWSGADQQALCLDWSVVSNVDHGARVTNALDRCRYFGGTTDIGRAAEFGLQLLETSPFVSYYRIVFLLTNGRTDRGSEPVLSAARDQAERDGVTLTAYALLHRRPDKPAPSYVPDRVQLERYAADHIVAGPRAFVAHSRPKEDHETLLQALIEMLRQELN